MGCRARPETQDTLLASFDEITDVVFGAERILRQGADTIAATKVASRM